LSSAPPAGTVLGPLDALPDGVTERTIERSSVLLVRRGTELRAYANACPHQWLPLTYRSPKILSADGKRLRCSNHGALFRVEDGSPVGPAVAPCGLETVPVAIDGEGQVVVAQA
jgi:nitrite reductase/ring-hydroxylating ferredoxin subunit